MPLQRFTGKVALISGGTHGIGLATARRLGQEGCKVVLSSRRQTNVDDAVTSLMKEGIEASGVAGNQRLKEDRLKLIQHACDKYGGFDCLFVSAGVSPHKGSILTVTEEQFDRAFDTNLKANFLFIQEVMPHFELRGSGSIVTHATMGVYDVTMATVGKKIQNLWYILQTTAYIDGAPTARELKGLATEIAGDCYNKNVRINCVAPAAIETRFLKGGLHMESLQKYIDIAHAKFGSDEGVRMTGRPEEVASAVSFLLSDDASFMTGNCLLLNGGYTLNRSL